MRATGWRPALRMARRDMRRHKWRTVLTALLVAVPVMIGTAVATLERNTSYTGEDMAYGELGSADARVKVSPFAKVKPVYWHGYMSVEPAAFTRADGRRRPVRRDRSAVDLRALLPEGTRLMPDVVQRRAMLASGGSAYAILVDAADPMAVGIAGVETGRAPDGPLEAAIAAPAASELGMLEDGRLRPDATLALADGTDLHVVGLLSDHLDFVTLEILASSDSVLRRKPPHEYLVDLPDLSRPELRALVDDLGEAGVAMHPRDALLHPEAWGARGQTEQVDVVAAALGAVVVLFGALYVVLIAGSAFAVGARRQVRDLGLVAASGGAARDVRRVVLAQGLLLGVGASVAGAAAGIGLFYLGLPVYEELLNDAVWSREVPWSAVAAVAVLGSTTGLLAALLPAWSIGRLTPVAALSGRFPVRRNESKAHRPGLWLASFGGVTLVLAGLWTAREFAPTEDAEAYMPSPFPLALSGLGLVLLLGGTAWAAPYVIRRAAALGRALPLAGRFAFRDAARHRFRSAAAAIALTITVAGTVFAGFAINSATAAGPGEDLYPPNSLKIYVDPERTGGDWETAGKATETVRHVFGDVDAHWFAAAHAPGEPRARLGLVTGRRVSHEIEVVSARTLRFLLGAPAPGVLDAFRSGAVVTTLHDSVQDGRASVGTLALDTRQELPAVTVGGRTGLGGMTRGAWVNRDVARSLGLEVRPSSALVMTDRPVTGEDMTRLSAYGVEAWSRGPTVEVLRQVRLGVVGVTGLVALLVSGIAVALAAAEGRADVATMAAVGAGPWRRRAIGAMHGLFLGLVGVGLGVVVGLPAGAALTQADGIAGVPIPWLALGTTVLVVPLFAAAAGWLVTPSRLALVRRTS